MQENLDAEKLQENILIASEKLKIQNPAIVEKDFYVVRHIYDLAIISQNNAINNNDFNLANFIIKRDVDKFKNQHPEYS